MKKQEINQCEKVASNSMKHFIPADFQGQYLLCSSKLLS